MRCGRRGAGLVEQGLVVVAGGIVDALPGVHAVRGRLAAVEYLRAAELHCSYWLSICFCFQVEFLYVGGKGFE